MQFFAINGMIGASAYSAEVDFLHAEELIAYMDYLLIDRMLVESRVALEYSPVLGNKMLVDEIVAFQERLLPVFTLTPSDYFEYGTLEWLKEQAANNQKAFSIDPSIGRFSVREMEFLLQELEEFEPVIFVNSLKNRDDLVYRDIEYLAKKMPGLKFVLTQVMWGTFCKVQDLLHRCNNVYIDISFLHMRDTLEFIRDEFGIERMLFGIGYKSHYGSAIATLAQSSLNEQEKQAIAHKNLENLLNIAPLQAKLAKAPAILAEKPVWQAFSQGTKLSGFTTFDAHSHTGPFARGWFLRDLANLDTQLQNILNHMDKVGVEKIAMIGESALFSDPIKGNRDFELLAEKYTDRICAYFVYNPYYNEQLSEKLLDEFFSRGFFIGFKTLCSYWKIKINDPSFSIMWEYADKYKLPILNHSWNDNWNAPEELTEIAPKYPNAIFILGHAGGGTPGRLQAEKLALQFPNVYLETCGSFCAERCLAESIKVLGADRFVFGSDTGGHNQAFEIGTVLSNPLPDKELIPILGENFAKIVELGIRD